MQLDSVLGLLPRVIRQVVDAIGTRAALQLVETFGGSTYRVPLRKTAAGEKQFQLVADVIGSEAAQQLVQKFGGQELYLANCAEALRELRNREIRAEFDRLTQIERMAAMRAVALMAPRYRKSDRQIWRILNETDRNGPAASPQARLF
ncbi:Mor transcription activator family protein [Ralstonia mannitolilytica]|uniref:Mor transcription activator family protein n=1 Tax=Ralstonia mannitolilytica TaxID=105219 RepID=UPI000CEED22C|nr:Mor transcription activator family protein [Ralstonia mannitolilytica]